MLQVGRKRTKELSFVIGLVTHQVFWVPLVLYFVNVLCTKITMLSDLLGLPLPPAAASPPLDAAPSGFLASSSSVCSPAFASVAASA